MGEMKHAIKGGISLTALKSGEKAKILSLRTDDTTKTRKLAAFGIMAGMDLTVIQKYPAVVIQIGYTQVALDNDIASEIIVEVST